MGKVVRDDVKAANKLDWTHADKISELEGDSGLSASYVKELIQKSGKSEDLVQLANYLSDPEKTANVGKVAKMEMLGMVKAKLGALQDQENLKAFLSLLRDHGMDWLH